jgi:hypothetical protein
MRGRGLLLIVVVAAAFGAAGRIAVPAPDDPAAARATQLVYQLADAEAGAAAADALCDLGAAAVPALVAAFGDAAVRDSAIAVVERIGPAAKDAVPALIVIAQDAASPSRRVAVHALGAIGADATPALNPLTALVGDLKAKLQAEAADAIGRIAVDAALRPVPKSARAIGVEKAIDAGLDWLDRHQEGDGRWSSTDFTDRCAEKPGCDGAGGESHDPGVTGLALLAHLAAGETTRQGRRRAVVEAALAWLMAHQRADGLLGDDKTTDRAAYEHACASLALSEAYRLTKLPKYAEPVRRAVAFISASQNAGWGWRYKLKPGGDNDTSVTAWMTRVLASASAAGVQSDPSAVRGALAWVDSMTEPEYGRTGYQQRGGPPARFNEELDKYPVTESESLTAAGLLVRFAAKHTAEDDPLIVKGLALLAAHPPRWAPELGSVDLYYWLLGSEATRIAGGAARQGWDHALAVALVPVQNRASKGCVRGSWDPVGPFASVGGRVYSTSLALIALGGWSDDPPEKKPALPGAYHTVVWALEKALKSPDERVRRAAQHALDSIRGAYVTK